MTSPHLVRQGRAEADGQVFSVVACALVAAVVLVACAPVTAPLGPANDTPALDGDTFLTRDGLRLPFAIGTRSIRAR